MPCFARGLEARACCVPRLRSRHLVCLVVLLAHLVGTDAPGLTRAGFSIEHASTMLRDGVYYVDATIDLSFSEKTQEALENGVPLTIRFDFEVLRVRRWLWNEKVAALQASYLLELHALSRQYVVRNLNLGTTQSYASLPSARTALGSMGDFPLVDAHLLDATADYRWRMRARLDIEALPAPLRPLAYVSTLWRHDSDWYEWPLSR
jgi:hypothetical protein